MSRPGGTILIVGRNEDEIGLLRFVLRNVHRKSSMMIYKVDSCSRGKDAIERLSMGQTDLVIIMEPHPDIQTIADSVLPYRKLINSLVIVNNMAHIAKYHADAVLARPSTSELLEKIAFLLQRRRGPRPGFSRKSVESIYETNASHAQNTAAC